MTANAAAAGRLAGVDLARALAIVGMMTAHIVTASTPGLPGLAYELSSGRASALFGVLAGVSLGLLTRRELRLPPGPAARRERAAAALGVLVRALLITLLGLWLVGRQSVVAVILPYYGLAFLLLLPVLWWPLRRLAVLAGAWLLLAPVAGHALRRDLPMGPGPQPGLAALAEPVDLLTTLLLTGYYPVIVWAGYLLLGLAVSRLDLRSGRIALGMAGAGAVLAAGADLAGRLLLGPAGGAAELVAADSRAAALLAQPHGFYGTTPATSWWWLAVGAPHSGTPVDAVGTAGAALLLLAAALALPAAVTRWLVPLTAVGSMPLTVYTAHVLAIGLLYVQAAWLLGLHLLVALLLATAWRMALGRGPLEEVVGAAARGAGALLRRGWAGPGQPGPPPHAPLRR
ncbi:uncharacterized protein DUF1624 [Kineococcus xinjiangensis]|uniref:Uncharacterized protein DUF1624 n=1 Tax=Kineococcus xinjiangensis TaxID=512762 RepID=A0A2S6IWE7_9ACTN|nr:heparan-alpha-glucosaminide N-acetyltransferase domain-containing protein [Kineococcus xinjiangensis]PPK98481.1 uncharacterized protein DUF1624 [Kineococcus xinjiangensis]